MKKIIALVIAAVMALSIIPLLTACNRANTINLLNWGDYLDPELIDAFKQATGFGLREYLVNLRIQRACELLLSTTLSITDIADKCGFNDSNYFGDAFRKAIGVSPRDYRKLG